MADRLDYFFKQPVTEAELDLGFANLEDADRFIVSDLNLTGIISGGVVTEHSPTADLTVDVTGSFFCHSPQGERIAFTPGQNVDLSVDNLSVSTAVGSGGNAKIVSLFVKFDRTLSDPRLDGASQTVFFVQDESFEFFVTQGAEATSGSEVPPPLEADGILLVDVTLIFGQTQILNADLDTSRRQEVVYARADQISVVDNFPNLDTVVTNVQETLEALISQSEDPHGPDITISSQLLVGRTGLPTTNYTLEADMDGTVPEQIFLHDVASELFAGFGGKGLRLTSAPGAFLGHLVTDVVDLDIPMFAFSGIRPAAPSNAASAVIVARGIFSHGPLNPGDGLTPTKLLLTPKDTVPSTVLGQAEFYTGLVAAKVFDVILKAGSLQTEATGGIIAALGNILASAGNIRATLGDLIADAGDVVATLGEVRGIGFEPTETVRNVTLSVDQAPRISQGQTIGTVARVDAAGVLVGAQHVNVASITDNGAGDHTVNFDRNHADANYIVQVSLDGAVGRISVGTIAAGSVQVLTFNTSDVAEDREFHLTTVGVLV